MSISCKIGQTHTYSLPPPGPVTPTLAQNGRLYREDFNNDAVEAGDIGAGQTFTALYEFTPAGSGTGQIEDL